MNHKNIILLFGLVSLLFGAAACSEKESFDESSAYVGASRNDIILSALGGIYDLEVYANGDYHLEFLDEVDWLTLDVSKTVKNIATISMEYDANEGFARMMKFVMVSDVETERCDTITVRQRGGKDPVLRFSQRYLLTLASAEGTVEVPIVTNISTEEIITEIDYMEEDGEKWVSNYSIVGASSSEDRTLTVSYSQNTAETPRSVTIRFTYTDGWGTTTVSDEVSLLQCNKDEEPFTTISFEELRNTYSTGEKIEDYVAIDGIVVSNKDNNNAGAPIQTDKNTADFTPELTTVYFESDDAKYGIVINMNSETDNIFDQFDRVTLLLTGSKITVRNADRTNCPTSYELSDFSPSYVYSQEAGDSAPVKEKTISELTDDDIYTYVSLKDVQIPIRKGALSPDDGSYSLDANANCTVTKTPRVIIDKNGDDLYMLTNGNCLYRRDGTRLPYGSGKISGVVVHEHYCRYGWMKGYDDLITEQEAEELNENLGNIGKYQLRHQTKDDVWKDMTDDFEDGFTDFICEYRYSVYRKNTHEGVFANATSLEDSIAVPSYGSNGWLTHTYQTYFGASGSYTNSSKRFSGGRLAYDYLGPCGHATTAQFGENFGNKNGIGIVVSDKEQTDYWSGRFAYNKGIEGYYGQEESKMEFACQYSKDAQSGYGGTGWVTNDYSGTATVPNGDVRSNYKGYGLLELCGIDYDTSYWWDSTNKRFYSFLVYFSTASISSDVVTLQLSIRGGTSTAYGPNNWCVEWAETDSQAEADDSKWNMIGEFIMPPALNMDSSNSTNRRFFGGPGYRQVSLKVSTDILGKDNVYVRIRPVDDVCSSASGYGDTNCATMGDKGVSLGYFAVRYNK